jgi:site-specific DNA recombinase
VIDGATPAIVDADLFRTVQARLDQPMVRPVPPHTRYLLSGFIRCACGAPVSGHEMQQNHDYRYYRCTHTAPRTNRPRLCDAKGIRVSVLEPRAWDEVCKVIENPETVLNELRARQGRATELDEEIERIQVTIKTLDAQKQRAMRLFTIAEADDADVTRELGRINKLHGQARARLAELEGRRAVSVQFEPMAEKVMQYCALMRDRLNDLGFEQKREVLEALQAQFTLKKDGNLRILVDEAPPQTVEPGQGGCAGLRPSGCEPARAGSFTRCARYGPSGAALTPLSLMGVADDRYRSSLFNWVRVV